MQEKYRILKDSKDGSFEGRDGDTVKYFWTKALRLSDGVTIEFGGKNPYREGEEINAVIEKRETSRGIGYREVQ